MPLALKPPALIECAGFHLDKDPAAMRYPSVLLDFSFVRAFLKLKGFLFKVYFGHFQLFSVNTLSKMEFVQFPSDFLEEIKIKDIGGLTLTFSFVDSSLKT